MSELNRFYGELRLNLSRRGKKRLPERIKLPLEAVAQSNQGCSCGFMAHAPWSGRRFRTRPRSLPRSHSTSKAHSECLCRKNHKTDRNDVLDCYVFDSLQVVRQMTADWLRESLGRISPVKYRVKKFHKLYV